MFYCTNDNLVKEILLDPNFTINSDGTIFRFYQGKLRQVGLFKKNKVGKSGLPQLGYCYLSYKYKMITVHRVIWAKFGNKQLRKSLFVNHKNGITTDNRIENLELVTIKQNNIHSFRILKRKPSTGGRGKKKKKVDTTPTPLVLDTQTLKSLG